MESKNIIHIATIAHVADFIKILFIMTFEIIATEILVEQAIKQILIENLIRGVDTKDLFKSGNILNNIFNGKIVTRQKHKIAEAIACASFKTLSKLFIAHLITISSSVQS